jgi:hypothetical protein
MPSANPNGWKPGLVSVGDVETEKQRWGEPEKEEAGTAPH